MSVFTGATLPIRAMRSPMFALATARSTAVSQLKQSTPMSGRSFIVSVVSPHMWIMTGTSAKSLTLLMTSATGPSSNLLYSSGDIRSWEAVGSDIHITVAPQSMHFLWMSAVNLVTLEIILSASSGSRNESISSWSAPRMYPAMVSGPQENPQTWKSSSRIEDRPSRFAT